MNKIPTAEEFCKQFRKTNPIANAESIEHWMGQHCIEFAKLHVQAAKEEISEKADMIGVTQHDNGAPDKSSNFVYVVDSNGPDYGYTVNKESILNAYPLTNIK